MFTHISKEKKYFFLFFTALVLIGVFLHYTGYTFQVVDQIYCRNHLPWSFNSPDISCGYRSGDDLFENDFISSELTYLSDNPYQHTFSERVMNGYPIRDGYVSNTNTIFHFLNGFLPPYSSINFSALAVLFISFVLGYYIAKSLGFSSFYRLILGTLSITPIYVNLSETWNAPLIGYGFLILGILQFYKYNRYYVFLLFSIVGAFLILSSSVYQFYIYTFLNLILLGLFYFWCKDKRKFIILWMSVAASFVVVAMFLNFSLERHYDFLSTSQKANNEISSSELLKSKRFTLDPIAWIASEVVVPHSRALDLVLGKEKAKFFHYFQSRGYGLGIAYLFFVVLGLFQLWKRHRSYVLILSFWFLYAAGVLQLLLSLIFGEPFLGETSIRASFLFFLFGGFAVVYAMRELIERKIVLSGTIKKVIYFGIYYVLFLSVLMLVGRALMSHMVSVEAIYTAISAVFLIIGLKLLAKPKTPQGGR